MIFDGDGYGSGGDGYGSDDDSQLNFNLDSSAEVENNNESDSTGDEMEDDIPPAKKSKKTYDYEQILTLSTDELEPYKQSMKDEGMIQKSAIPGKNGITITLECNKRKAGCPYAIIIRTSTDGSSSNVSHRVCGHEHKQPPKLTKLLKAFLSANSKLTPARIQMKLKV
uniref:Transposase MuDR plant domain-containing protein n=1 Tax=Panagrolaimus davidi TaxID=227884 RepID=A0A914QXG7_9BILA